MAPFLVFLNLVCSGPASLAGTAYVDCHPNVGELVYCPDEVDPEEADCVITWVTGRAGEHNIVRWEHAK